MERNKISSQLVLLLVACVQLQLCVSTESVLGLHRRHLVASSASAHCQSNWVMNQNKTKCFQYVAKSKSWDESEAYCNNHEGHLASLSSLQELKFVEKLCSKKIGGCWIGGRVNSTANNGWRWSDNKSQHNDSFFPKVQFGLNCGNKSCHNNKTNDSCTLLSYGVVAVKSEGCNKSHGFICMVNIVWTVLQLGAFSSLSMVPIRKFRHYLLIY